jgi:hypothetical protein
VGWVLSAYHIFWLVGAFVTVVALALALKSSPWLEHSVRFCSRGLVGILMTLIISTLLALAVTWPLLLTLIVIPFVTTFLAEIEMRFAGFSQLNKFLFLTLTSGFGLGLGEMIDLLLLPSVRY